jgi:hypothetical protein
MALSLLFLPLAPAAYIVRKRPTLTKRHGSVVTVIQAECDRQKPLGDGLDLPRYRQKPVGDGLDLTTLPSKAGR